LQKNAARRAARDSLCARLLQPNRVRHRYASSLAAAYSNTEGHVDSTAAAV